MINRLKLGTVAAVTFAASLSAASPAQADHQPYYGMRAAVVADHLDCRNFTSNGSGRFHLASGVCWLRGRRVNLITFRGPGQQGEWNGAATIGFGPRFHWAVGRGANIVARNGNLDAARVGARALPGNVRHG